MKRRGVWNGFNVLFALLLVITSLILTGCFGGKEESSSGGTTYTIADYCPVAVGNMWLYQDDNGTYEWDYYVAHETYEGKDAYKDEEGWYYHVSSTDGLWDYDEDLGKWVQDLPAQMKVGDSFSWTEKITDENGTEIGTFKHTVTLEAVEDVTVPAGTFSDALKIKFEETYASGETYTVTGTVWLAKGVGEVKYEQDDGTMEELVYASVNGKTYGEIPADAPAQPTLETSKKRNTSKSLKKKFWFLKHF
jgi:hypothetical protein